eukprot:CAMPEP_0173394286 /NCGR_PEP_ID=MMETSP1356-20130122/26477_1 /TAXON_ID=77927 ORGANISM="Hemiselmis virescens, Strain PCC157" /NCGR_SAMPLE_ID=MMETSP1356 /ASSEMBLY_ACC=CAM_ASM_000847 /LENGTH=64 /DNA_ID=CAMNT_0014352577 /DNA_START=68 /DNA_END=258 /DNA_ORIENTATION=+
MASRGEIDQLGLVFLVQKVCHTRFLIPGRCDGDMVSSLSWYYGSDTVKGGDTTTVTVGWCGCTA